MYSELIFTSADVVPCDGHKGLPFTSISIVQIIFSGLLDH